MIFPDDPGIDDTIDTGKSDGQGNFVLKGETSEFTDIDPVLKIYHDCNDGKPGQRRWVFELPKKYIRKGKSATPYILDVGVFNLEIKPRKEDRDLIH